jgi:hypothetical protein
MTQTGCRGPACRGPCDAPASAARAPITINRGDSVVGKWPRNNHAAGFIRWAWAKTSESDSHAAFDSNVQLISCHETGKVAGGACAPSNAALPNGGDANPASGETGACTRQLTVPLHLANGRYTLQWAWFGGAFNLGDYYSCIDYEIVGGPTGAKEAPVFDGGDFSNPTALGSNGKCKFFNTAKLHTCVDEPCFNGELPGQNNGAPASFGGGSSPSTPAPSTPAPSTPVPTATAQPSASATPKPATPMPTASATAKPATPVPVPVPVPVPNPGATAGSCDAGSSCSDFSMSFALTDKWLTGMAASVKATAQRAVGSWQLSWKIHSNMKIAAIWNCQLISTHNNGDGTTTVLVKNPSWQTSVPSGSVLDIGFTVSFPQGQAPTVSNRGFGLTAASRADVESAADADGAGADSAGKSSGMSTAAAIATGVGAAVGTALLALGVVLGRRRYLKRNAPKAPGSEEIQFSNVAQESPAMSVH